VRKFETAADIGIRRQSFIRAMQVHRRRLERNWARLVEASVADLEWLIGKIADH